MFKAKNEYKNKKQKNAPFFKKKNNKKTKNKIKQKENHFEFQHNKKRNSFFLKAHTI